MIETQLSKADPDHANDYKANADEFAGQLKDLDKRPTPSPIPTRTSMP